MIPYSSATAGLRAARRAREDVKAQIVRATTGAETTQQGSSGLSESGIRPV
jgi:hypothetical protein